MQYDRVKNQLGNIFNKTPFLKILFYRLLDLLLLRTWHIRHELKKFLHKKINPSVLDAGSGFGQYSWFLSGYKPDAHILGVDVKEDLVQEANSLFQQKGKNQKVKFKVADLTKFIEPGEFDLILSVDVMEHILEDSQVFSNFYTSLKKGGMVLISTPSDQGGSDVHEDDEDSFIEEHVRDGYNIEVIDEKLRAAGFNRVESRYSYGKPGRLSWKLSMKYPMLILGKSKYMLLLLVPYYLIVFPFCLLLNYLDLKINHDSGTGLIVKAWKL
jgi:SAM-dependent methyltransferase